MKKIVLSILCCLTVLLQLNPVEASLDKKITINHEVIEDGEYTIEIITYEVDSIQTRSTSTKKVEETIIVKIRMAKLYGQQHLQEHLSIMALHQNVFLLLYQYPMFPVAGSCSQKKHLQAVIKQKRLL